MITFVLERVVVTIHAAIFNIKTLHVFTECTDCNNKVILVFTAFFSPGATTPLLGVVFYSPLAGFSLLACEVS